MGEIGEYWRDVREHRKRQKRQRRRRREKRKSEQNNSEEKHERREMHQIQSQSPPRRRCWDWMITSGNCHYAKNRSSFKEYRRLNLTIGNIGLSKTRVIGIGTVELVVKRSPGDEGANILVLENVLHIPDAICNGFSPHLTRCAHSWTKEGIQGFDNDDRPIWFATKFAGLNRFVLFGNPQGESKLAQKHREGVMLLLSVFLTPGELEYTSSDVRVGPAD